MHSVPLKNVGADETWQVKKLELFYRHFRVNRVILNLKGFAHRVRGSALKNPHEQL
jgi:hypothetical protein